jgi:MoxR-like ATPase
MGTKLETLQSKLAKLQADIEAEEERERQEKAVAEIRDSFRDAICEAVKAVEKETAKDHRRRAWVPALKREAAVASGVVFFVTLNEGYEYVGTNPIDEALRDRMTYAVRMGYVPKKVEKAILTRRTGVDGEAAEKLAEFARTVRRNPKLGVPVSTRQLLGAASLVVEGMALQDAVLFSVVNGMGEEVDRKALLQALQVIGKVDEAYVEGQAEEEDQE